jgi:hypothetical protein
VIHLRFSQMPYNEVGLTEAISRHLRKVAAEHNLTLKADNIKELFTELIEQCAKTEKVIILIDEYDKPIIDNLEKISLAEENRSVMKTLYSILKDADEHIRFLIITGVSKFSKVSIFSDLNNLRDISLSQQFASLLGITQPELKDYFNDEIQQLQAGQPDIMAELKKWYNGYSWNNGKDLVYNPFSILNFMADKAFRNFWFETGTPTFLIEQLKKKGAYDFEKMKVGPGALGNFMIENIQPATLLFQTGYLTIKNFDARLQLYELDYPNIEVKASLLDYLLSAYRYTFPSESRSAAAALYQSLEANDIEAMVKVINTVMSTIPYDLWKGASEFYYHTIVHLTFTLTGIYVQSEVHTANGRCDAIVQTDTHIYALEFKLDRSAGEAVRQIEEKGYLAPYAQDKRTKTAIGINFSSETRKVEDFLVKSTNF